MPVFMCRWPNGDCSFVAARTKAEAIMTLDEVDNAEAAVVRRVQDFMVHLNLVDQGEFQFEDFGEQTWQDVDRAYPYLADADGASLETVREAVTKERERLDERNRKLASTELGRRIQSTMDAPSVLVDKIVQDLAKETLEDYEPDGEPH